MDATQVYTILGIAVALVALISTIVFWLIAKLHTDIKSLATSIEGINSNLNGWVQHLTAMQAEQSKRFDQFLFEWNKESKNFHERMCKIEEGRVK